MNECPRIAVVGGGLSGLAAAHRLGELANAQQRRIDVTLLEAGPRLGGLIGTQHIDGHIVELGADSFITNKPWAVNLCERLSLTDQLISTNPRYQRSLILLEGHPVPTPEGFELLLPRQLKSLLSSPFLSLPGKLQVANEAFMPPKLDNADESLADFVRRRFGQELLDRIVQPMVGGIYTADPEHLSMRATLPRFVQREQQHGSLLRSVWYERRIALHSSDVEDLTPSGISGARYGLFVSLKGGMSQLLTTLGQRVQKSAHVITHAVVKAIEPIPEGGSLLTTIDGERQPFDAVILALPADRAGELVRSWDAELSTRLSRIPYASSAIVVTAHRLTDITHPLDAFGLVIPHAEGRRVLAVSFLSRKFAGRSPDGTVQLRTFVGGAMQPQWLEQDDDSLVHMVREELQALLGVQGEPLFQRVARYERAMPQYHVGHLDLVTEIESLQQRHPGFALAGNAYRGVGIPDSIHSGEQAAERVFSTLS